MNPAPPLPGFTWRERPGTPGAPVLVCLHGIGSDAGGFAALVPHLPAEWRVLAWDAPGYGGSDRLAPEWPVAADYATALARFLDAAGVERAMVIGHSLGTLMGAAFARAHPDRVERLILAACAQGQRAAPGGKQPDKAAARLDDLARLGPRAFAEARAPRLLHRPDADPAVTGRLTDTMAAIDPAGYGQAVRMLASGDLAADCAALSVPTWVMVGAQDIITPVAQSRQAHQALPAPWRRGLTVLPGLGHALLQEGPEACAELVAAIARESFRAA
ncbi:MAG: alpha/beta fold hydrolase [Rhodobacteraceae bacterium]|nr:alpha/beta fold hydrolase [Paracoccaceae bacterium]